MKNNSINKKIFKLKKKARWWFNLKEGRIKLCESIQILNAFNYVCIFWELGKRHIQIASFNYFYIILMLKIIWYLCGAMGN